MVKLVAIFTKFTWQVKFGFAFHMSLLPDGNPKYYASDSLHKLHRLLVSGSKSWSSLDKISKFKMRCDTELGNKTEGLCLYSLEQHEAQPWIYERSWASFINSIPFLTGVLQLTLLVLSSSISHSSSGKSGSVFFILLLEFHSSVSDKV
jgi:hypothetical protein